MFLNKNTNFWRSYFRSKTESIAICESSTGIMEDTCTIHLPLKVCRCAGVLGDNNIGMVTTVFMNMADGVIDIGNHFYGAFKCTIFGSHAFGGRRTESQQLS